ncbi:hypothetical protein D3C81_746490 [compost metagenome]
MIEHVTGDRVGDQGKEHAKQGGAEGRQIPLLAATQHQHHEGRQQHDEAGTQQADGPHFRREAVAVAPLEEDAEGVVLEFVQQTVVLEVGKQRAADQGQSQQAGAEQAEGAAPLLTQTPVAEQHQIPGPPEGAVVGAHPGHYGEGEGRHQGRAPAKLLVQQQGDEGPLGDEGQVEGPVLGHVAVVVAGAVEREERQHAAEACPQGETQLGEGLPAGEQAEPAEDPLQQPDPEEAPQMVSERIEGEDHGALDVDHVPIEHAPLAPHLAHHSEQGGIKAGRHAVEQRVAQAKQQRHQGGEQDNQRLEPGVVALRGKTDGVIHG